LGCHLERKGLCIADQNQDLYLFVPLRRFQLFSRYLFVLCLLAVVVSEPISAPAQQAKPDAASMRDQFVGAWRLVSIETIRPNGEIIYPFYSKHPEGLIVYDNSGWMSVQITSDPRPTVPKDSSREAFLAAPPLEKVAAVEGYYAYCGTWTLAPSNSTVTHHIKKSMIPGERGEDGVRHYTLEGDRLTLVAKTHEMGEDHERKLVWQRLQKDQP
jgi:hypothetical protein